MPNDLTAPLLSLAIAGGSLWLAADYFRQRSLWFAWLFALLAVERLAAVCAVPAGHLLAGVPLAGAGEGVRLAIALILARLVVGRCLYLFARKRNLLESTGERRA